jgi:hypothetical protein
MADEYIGRLHIFGELCLDSGGLQVSKPVEETSARDFQRDDEEGRRRYYLGAIEQRSFPP